MHGSENVSPWVTRWARQVKPGSRVLDVACGAGRHSLHFLKQNCHVTAVDIAQDALDLIAIQLNQEQSQRCRLVCADLEKKPWPLPKEQFDAVVVTHYLWRPLMPLLLASLRPDGLLIYETFAVGNETVGKPSRPDFLLRRGELLDWALKASLTVIAYEDGFLTPPDRFVQHIAAVAPPEATTLTPIAPRYDLSHAA